MGISNILTLNETSQRKFAVMLSYVNIAFAIISTLLYTPFFLRILGQSEYGLYSLAQRAIGYLAILDLGFGNAIVVYTAKYALSGEKEREKKLHGTIFSVYLVMSFVAVILGILGIIFTDTIFGAKMSADEIYKIRIMFGLLTLNLAATFPFSIYSSILFAYENFIFVKLIAIFRTIALPLITIPVLLLGYKSVATVVIVTAVNLAALALNFIFCKMRINPKISVTNFDFSLLKEIFGYSFFIFLGIIVDQVNWHVAHFILGVVSGSKEVSIYAVASVINSFFITLSATISGVMLPKIAKMVSANSTNDKLTNEFIKIGRLQFYIIFFICSSFVIFGHEFMVLWAGQNYEQSYYVAMILTIPISIPLVQNLGISILQAKNMVKFRAIMAVIIACFNIAISISLAQKYGSIGAACGTAMALSIFNIFIMNFYYHFKIGLNIPKFWLEIGKMLAISLVCVVAILAINYALNLKGVTYLIVCGGIYGLIYLLVSYKFIMNNYEKAIFQGIFTKIRSKF